MSGVSPRPGLFGRQRGQVSARGVSPGPPPDADTDDSDKEGMKATSGPRPKTPAAASPRLAPPRLTWRWARQQWKLLVVGFLILYQVVGLVWLNGNTHPAPSDHPGAFHGGGHGSADDVILSAPVAPDFPDLRPWDRGGAARGGAAGTPHPGGPGEGKEKEKGGKPPPQGGGGGSQKSGSTVPAHAEQTAASGSGGEESLGVAPVGGGGGEAVERATGAPPMRRAVDERQIRCSPLALLFGFLGGTCGLGLSCLGAASGIAQSGKAMAQLGLGNFYRGDKSMVLRGMLPVIMAELLSIYGLITGVTITIQISQLKDQGYPLAAGFLHFGSGLIVGGSCLLAGHTIGVIGDVCNRAMAESAAVFSPMILLLIFAEALALYGLICSLLMNGTAQDIAAAHACAPLSRHAP